MHNDHDQGTSLTDDSAGSVVVRPASLLSRGFVAWTELCLRVPAVITLVAILLAVASGVYAAKNLGYKVSRVDLLDPESEYNKLWIDYIAEFGDDDDAVIVVEGPSREDVIRVLEEVSREAGRRDDLFHSVLHEVDLSAIRGKGLHYLSPSDLMSIERFVEQTQPIIDGGWAQLKAGSMVAGMAGQMVAGAASQAGSRDEDPATVLERYTESLLASVDAVNRTTSPRRFPRHGHRCRSRCRRSATFPANTFSPRTVSWGSCCCDFPRPTEGLPVRRRPPTSCAGSSPRWPAATRP